jgi:hypothetical protein
MPDAAQRRSGASAEEAVRRGRQIVVRGPSTSSGSVIVADNNWQTLFDF